MAYVVALINNGQSPLYVTEARTNPLTLTLLKSRAYKFRSIRYAEEVAAQWRSRYDQVHIVQAGNM